MTEDRQAHALLDLHSRGKKALKIERLLNLENFSQPIRLLEIGTGSGGISSYFGNHPKIRCNVSSVDVVDLRISNDGYQFQLVSGTEVPYSDAQFDVVISNHVIEHVGTGADQLQHLKEICRVLKPNGTGYLAVPNRWSLIEPHYRLAFLSCIPQPMRTPYLKLRKRGTYYDCEPLTLNQTECLLNEAGLKGFNKCPEATIMALQIERPNSLLTMLVQKIPKSFIGLFNQINPTLIYKIHRIK
ncbi:MAG: class I SAM-dependent methyltransferase [Cellvibrionaceae bacterium]|nr:class I SAM-dependent methyltransferase [Cellvibrionaceae bacterium]